MASLYLRGKTFYICFYDNGKKYDYSLKTKDKRLATFKKNDIENRLAVGDSPVLQKNIPIDIVYAAFLKRCRATAKPPTVRYYEDIIGPFLKYLPAGASIHRVKPKTIEQYLESKAGKIGPGMVWHILKALKTFFNFAKREKAISENPVTRKKPRLAKKLPECWTPAEIKRILAHTEGTLVGRMIRFNLYVGLRPAELLRLKWSDIDFEGQFLTVQEAKDGEFRKVSLHPEAIRAIKDAPQDGVLVFRGIDFEFMRYHAWKIKKNLNLRHIKRFWYATRHTFATTYYEKTRDLRGLQEILGHSKIEMTTVYVNPNEEHRKEQLKKLEYRL